MVGDGAVDVTTGVVAASGTDPDPDEIKKLS